MNTVSPAGRAETGGACAGTGGCGIVFKISPTGAETVLYSFAPPPDAILPSVGLVLDAQGNLYGTTG